MPTYVPGIKVKRASDEATVLNQLMPVVDKTVQVGLFCSRIFLGSLFAVGMHSVTMTYTVGAKVGIENRVFEVMAGGDPRGQVLSLYYLHKPHNDYLVYQAEAGVILKGTNPRIDR